MISPCKCVVWSPLGFNTPPNSLKDPNVSPRMKQQKKKKVETCSLAHNTSGVGEYVEALK
jgi:hypothetical protein